MTRKEEIEKVANDYCDTYNYRNHVKGSDGAPFTHFLQGARWADDNPKSPWTSVKDKLPDVDDDVLIADTLGNIYHAAYIKDNHGNDGFEVLDADFDRDAVAIAWMLIPPLPKEGGVA